MKITLQIYLCFWFIDSLLWCLAGNHNTSGRRTLGGGGGCMQHMVMALIEDNIHIAFGRTHKVIWAHQRSNCKNTENIPRKRTWINPILGMWVVKHTTSSILWWGSPEVKLKTFSKKDVTTTHDSWVQSPHAPNSFSNAKYILNSNHCSWHKYDILSRLNNPTYTGRALNLSLRHAVT